MLVRGFNFKLIYPLLEQLNCPCQFPIVATTATIFQLVPLLLLVSIPQNWFHIEVSSPMSMRTIAANPTFFFVKKTRLWLSILSIQYKTTQASRSVTILVNMDSMRSNLDR
ncbi:hypothetical protein BT96DRAFT_286812 [Gymnopus androsaceus JB14]|uniref:Uncharacterized protein n=1 Tax=Gymnopus androsaceus JB14 TaxID=1447944 RepID=A0A6A4H4R2_9AGAR|nr:hypothetical protein BT96DRAFT_286812 [Gymnopus androsaceus JB14]